MSATENPPAELSRDPSGDGAVRARGAWVLPEIARLAGQVDRLTGTVRQIDASGITRLDASGAVLLERLLRESGVEADAAGLPDRWRTLFDQVHSTCDVAPEPKPAREPQWRQLLERVGRSAHEVLRSTLELLNFLGLTLHRLARTALQPRRLQLTSVVYHMERTGLDAAPLLILLSFLVGAVVAFLGATVLRDFGAQLYVVDLVTVSFVREFGVLLTAILLAGRTASAFCAQIGMMKAREEIDAIRTLGLDEIELLVIPRLLALVITLPLLTFIATLSGLLGGLAVALLSLDLNFTLFADRVYQTLSLKHYLVGLIKAPIFAGIIALIGCLEGMRVAGTAQSVGEHTTIAVVRSLTMVIVVDALAAIYFMEIGW